MSTKLYALSLEDTVNLISIKGEQLFAIGETISEETKNVQNIDDMIALCDHITALSRILQQHRDNLPIKPGAALADAE